MYTTAELKAPLIYHTLNCSLEPCAVVLDFCGFALQSDHTLPIKIVENKKALVPSLVILSFLTLKLEVNRRTEK